MGGECGAGNAAVAVDNVDYARREASLFCEISEVEDGEWSLLGRFEDDGVSAGECWAEFPCCHGEGVVPSTTESVGRLVGDGGLQGRNERNDLPTNPDGLSKGIRKLVRCSINNLTKGLIRPARIVSQCLNDFGQILVSCHGEWLPVIPCFDCG